jgi:predicted transcriptional regulator
MAGSSSSSGTEFGPLEAEVMDLVWALAGPVSVGDIAARLNERRSEPLAYTTVMTVMSRLADKQVLERRRKGRGYLYEPSAADAAGLAVKNVIRIYGDEAMAHFFEEARADPKMLRRLQRLLGET